MIDSYPDTPLQRLLSARKFGTHFRELASGQSLQEFWETCEDGWAMRHIARHLLNDVEWGRFPYNFSYTKDWVYDDKIVARQLRKRIFLPVVGGWEQTLYCDNFPKTAFQLYMSKLDIWNYYRVQVNEMSATETWNCFTRFNNRYYFLLDFYLSINKRWWDGGNFDGYGRYHYSLPTAHQINSDEFRKFITPKLEQIDSGEYTANKEVGLSYCEKNKKYIRREECLIKRN